MHIPVSNLLNVQEHTMGVTEILTDVCLESLIAIVYFDDM